MKDELIKEIESNNLFPNATTKLQETDPEFIQIVQNFAFKEVVNNDNLDKSSRLLAIISTLIGCQGTDLFREMLPQVIHQGLSPIAIKEVVYQATAYLGIGRVYSFLDIVNKIFQEENISLPLEKQSTTSKENRLNKGVQMQVDIFGEHMKDFYKSGAEETKHINRWLAENCFGDYYTRGGLDMKQREMITFCFLSAQGGCEPQLTSHAIANIKIGNDREFFIDHIFFSPLIL